jgi:hypothetical protein
MTGVEILTSTEVAVVWEFNWVVFWIVSSIILVIVAAIGFWQWLRDYCDFLIVPTLIVVGLFGGVVIGALLGSTSSKPIEYTMEHKVIASDDVLLNEFNKKYEIVGQEGKIYIVREKVDEGNK